jgi:hypothetical protein
MKNITKFTFGPLCSLSPAYLQISSHLCVT